MATKSWLTLDELERAIKAFDLVHLALNRANVALHEAGQRSLNSGEPEIRQRTIRMREDLQSLIDDVLDGWHDTEIAYRKRLEERSGKKQADHPRTDGARP